MRQIAKFVVGLGEKVSPTDIDEGMRVGVDRQKYQIQIPLPPKIDPSVTMMTVEEKPDVTYADLGGVNEQVEKIREVVELPLLHVGPFLFLYTYCSLKDSSNLELIHQKEFYYLVLQYVLFYDFRHYFVGYRKGSFQILVNNLVYIDFVSSRSCKSNRCVFYSCYWFRVSSKVCRRRCKNGA